MSFLDICFTVVAIFFHAFGGAIAGAFWALILTGTWGLISYGRFGGLNDTKEAAFVTALIGGVVGAPLGVWLLW